MKDLNQVIRPKTWEEVVGQSDIKEICRKSLAEDKFPKFSIFYGPTGIGKSCIAELVAREITGYKGDLLNAPCIKKYNMAALMGKKDIVEVIDNIFKYKSMGKTVFILEEVQVMKQEEEQTPFLEELTRIPDDLYVMMCTTKFTALTPALRNRAVGFQLTLPTMEECGSYVDRITDRLQYQRMTEQAKQILIKASNFTPRSIVKHIELLASGDEVAESDVNKFFKTISSRAFIDEVRALVSPDISLYDFTKVTKAVIKDCSYTNFMYGLRDFVIQLLLLQAVGEMDTPLIPSEMADCMKLLADFDEAMFTSIFDALARMNLYHIESSNDVLAALIKMKLSLSKKSAATIMSSVAADTVTVALSNKRAAREIAKKAQPGTQEITAIDSSSNLSAFGIDDEAVYEER